MTQAQRALIIGTTAALLIEIAGLAVILGQHQVFAGTLLIVVGVLVDLGAILRWRQLSD